MVVPESIREELHEHAAEEAPNECCGVIVFRDGVAERYIRGRNRLASPYRYELEIDPDVWFLEDDGYVPPILDVSKLDRKILVSNAESVAAVHALLDREGIFAGVSAGAVVHVARKIAGELEEGSVVVAVLADGGWKYLSGDFWNADDVESSMEETLWW